MCIKYNVEIIVNTTNKYLVVFMTVVHTYFYIGVNPSSSIRVNVGLALISTAKFKLFEEKIYQSL